MLVFGTQGWELPFEGNSLFLASSDGFMSLQADTSWALTVLSYLGKLFFGLVG